MSRKVIPVSINDESIIHHLETKENVSRYIRNLIKKDMERGGLSPELKKYIEDYIQKNFNSIQINKEDNVMKFKDQIDEIFNI
ncbi:hypothetical protein FQB35_04695 [Crassaminicella thermophila]|uniref:Uncharacterized protein n=1 Tax=Crassaminicella thermophila TaxID=2599308 RepID=A0A5C0SCP4_CRATE|nr:hypothetical protein [Crassaminicella thermophila]QEK11717.1 hypothetical protein FQB35_04695 [Crassaminicella thermophila]